MGQTPIGTAEYAYCQFLCCIELLTLAANGAAKAPLDEGLSSIRKCRGEKNRPLHSFWHGGQISIDANGLLNADQHVWHLVPFG